MHALVFDAFGEADVLSYRERPDPEVAAGTALVRTRAIGLNFADIYRRRGNYHLEGPPPFILGYEGAGVVEAIGPDVPGVADDAAKLRVGDRVAFADVPHSNAELVRAPLDRLVSVPDAVSFETAAAVMLQGLTAQYLVRDSHLLRSGELAVVHAAAGGVGLMLVQLAKLAGARVLALTSSPAKAEAARDAGADLTASYDEDWPAIAHDVSAGKGADVVYDAVGSTLHRSLDAARTGGHVVFYGMAGGEPAPVDPRRLMDESKSLTGGDLWNVLTSATERRRRAGELFASVAQGALRVTIAATFPLAHGADAHRRLEGRGVIGKVLLIP